MTSGGRRGTGADWSPTHEVVCPGDSADAVAADTRLVAVACGFGDEARLTMATDDVSDRSPRTQRVLDADLDRLPDDATDGTDPTWRAPLPEATDALVSALTVDESGADGPLGDARWRVWDVSSVEVRRDGRRIYRSIPHHERFELAATGAPGLVDAACERLDDLPCAVVPTGPVATWGDGGELTHRGLRFEGGAGASLAHVRRVAVDRDRRAIVVDWMPTSERVGRDRSRAIRALLRAFVWSVERFGGSDSPPRRLSFADEASFREAVDGFETVRDRAGYDFETVVV
ncbi:hypothetical protein I7X12_19525 [Halosimplex litoreum]|uniref:Uncharacterized protein n=1 Tax=Halosimplex litoreum TaxID=1198301 RepID=A0A7T3KV29_9EURY|nr:hypothetical protein [Halosimplex litoreum]QPV62877.1 hypothetical protein I7X12_19525 [Halosimplex litoreum]